MRAQATGCARSRFQATRRASLLLLALLTASCSNQVPLKPLAPVHLTGVIRDRDGAGIPGAHVRATMASRTYAPFGPGTRGDATTDSSGAYSLDLLGTWYDIQISPPANSGYDYVSLRAIRFGATSTRWDYRFTGWRVAGTLVGPGGAPIDTGHVYLSEASGGYEAGLRTRQGAFSFLAPREGRYHLFAFSGVFADGLPFQDVVLDIHADTTVTVALDGAPVTGIVRGPTGEPMEGARVYAERSSGYSWATSLTQADGSYRVYLPTGNYRFHISPPPNASYILPRASTLIAVSGPMSLDFDLNGTTWSGVVRNLQGGPVASMIVGVTEAGGNDFYPQASFTTAGDGAYRLVVIPGREYSIRVMTAVSHDTWAYIPSLVAGADSTFDIVVDDSVPSKISTPSPPAAPGAPASAGADPMFPRRSSRTGG